MAKRITKVTTKRGDDGTTGMGDGTRVTKSNLLIKAIGDLDELNSWIGLLCSLEGLKENKEYLQNGTKQIVLVMDYLLMMTVAYA